MLGTKKNTFKKPLPKMSDSSVGSPKDDNFDSEKFSLLSQRSQVKNLSAYRSTSATQIGAGSHSSSYAARVAASKASKSAANRRNNIAISTSTVFSSPTSATSGGHTPLTRSSSSPASPVSRSLAVSSSSLSSSKKPGGGVGFNKFNEVGEGEDIDEIEELFEQRDEILEQLKERGLFPANFMKQWENDTGAYPTIDDPEFLQKLLAKREFADSLQTTWEPEYDPCGDTNAFEVTPVQRFAANLMSPRTPYMSALLFHGVGVGKTCAAVQIAEAWLEATQHVSARLSSRQLEEQQGGAGLLMPARWGASQFLGGSLVRCSSPSPTAI
jgi:hypothetical protein